MKKILLIPSLLLIFQAGLKAQSAIRVYVVIPEKMMEISADQLILTEDGCELSGNVKQEPYDEKLPIIDEHHVPGILTNENHIGNTWVLQCTAGPGYCFTYYTK